jgi:predicted negative regulator of RcsB-dependent stress response
MALNAETVNEFFRAVAALELSSLLKARGELDEAEALLAGVLASTRRSRDRRNEAAALHNLGHLKVRRGILNEALHLFEAAEKAFLDTGEEAMAQDSRLARQAVLAGTAR